MPGFSHLRSNNLLWVIMFLVISQTAISQNRAPSCWLKYPDHFQGDIIVNTVRVQSPSPLYTYYCTLQWNAGMEGGGYCGIQEHPDGRNFIFSIWDPKASDEAITAPYAHPETGVENFGGEGTGLKSWNFGIGWETDQWYSFVARAWDKSDHTMFGYWVYSHSDQQWYHLVTMDFPVPGVRFSSSTGSFIEDWLGNGESKREVHHKEGFKRRMSDQTWYAFPSAYFERVSPDAGANNFINSYDGGVTADHYFMKSGGTTMPVTNQSRTTLTLANNKSSPGFDTIVIDSLTSVIHSTNLELAWEVEDSTAPQFSFHLDIFDQKEKTGEPVLTYDSIVPQRRNLSVDLSSLENNAEYYYNFHLTDIFDNGSADSSGSFILGSLSGIEPQLSGSDYSVSPNPVENIINISSEKYWDQLDVIIYDTRGRVIHNEKYESGNRLGLPLSLDNGIYFLSLRSGGVKEFLKIIKI